MKIDRIALFGATLLVTLGPRPARAQERPAGRAAMSDARDEAVRRLIGRLDLEKYKATIKGLTQFGDRRQGSRLSSQ